MIYKPELSARILAAMQSVMLSNNGYADIGYNPDIANALHLAGFIVIESTTLHGNPTFKAFTKEGQAALRFAPHAFSTYRPVMYAPDYIDYEGAILARQESQGFYD